MPFILKTDGTMETIEKKPTLERLQEIVGGLIQYVPVNSGGFLYCNEEGKLIGLPDNNYATMIARLFAGDYIAGDVVVYSPEEAREEE